MKQIHQNVGRLLRPLLFILALVPALHAEDLKVRIGYSTTLHGEVAEVLGKSEIGKKNGLAIETSFFQYGPPQIEALAAGSLDLSFTSAVPTATYLSKQPGAVEVIAALGQSGHGLVVPADSPIKSIADFKDKKIAVAFGSDSHIDLLVDLKKAGLEPGKNVTVINVPPNEQPAALEQKLADGVILRQPQLFKFTVKGYREVVRWPHHLWVIARSEYLKEHPEAKAKIVQAIREAVLEIAQNPRQGAIWYGQTLRLDPALVEKIAGENPIYANVKELKDVNVTPSPKLKAFAAQRAQDLLDVGQSKKLAVIEFAP